MLYDAAYGSFWLTLPASLWIAFYLSIWISRSSPPDRPVRFESASSLGQAER